MSNFTRVAAMNKAFGNPQGDPHNIDPQPLRRQCLNIADELGELYIALGADPSKIKGCVAALKAAAVAGAFGLDLDGVRDALCDINVFSYGAHHLMGIDADADMAAVINGVMTRFVKDPEDLANTLDKHAAKGVSQVYLEGVYPTLVVKSAADQPDAPKGKFLKSASYQETVFPPI